MTAAPRSERPMATYEYLCSSCGSFETHLAMGSAGPLLDCPECGRPARRIFSAPYLARTPQAHRTALATAEQSGDEPQVVTEVPGSRRPPRRPHPALSRLPRP
ncbi:MAG TPA: zinc ribbon domain-containing protein [Pseudonocardiaceae bacterium]|nr:zinc ribbon domain-containing protein [Pseudonocardiaceae bacterium]